MTEWQPIETAPRDGTNILSWEHKMECMIIFWQSGDWHCTHDCEDLYFSEPTHWMPLPEPPKQESK